MKAMTLAILMMIPFVLLSQELSKEEKDRQEQFRKMAAEGRDTTKAFGWNPEAVTSLSLTQVSFKDWAQGGESALSYGLSFLGRMTHVAEVTDWSNTTKLTYGQTKAGDREFRKTDDEIYFESLLIYHLGTKVNPFGSFTLRTQFAPGYEFSGDTLRTQVSNFFDPGYLTQSVGVAFQPSPILTTRLGGALREVVTSQFNKQADDPDTPEIEKVKISGGLESVTSLTWEFAENMVLSSRLELFAPFSEFTRVIVRNDNIVAAKVNKVISVNFNIQFVNDVNVSRRTQIKETLALGISYTIL